MSRSTAQSKRALADRIVGCTACPRLVSWRNEAAHAPPKRFRGEAYWRKPVTGFGDKAASLLIVGLAPAAHGANRTGRIFTGDRSGDFLYAALHRAGFANQPTSVSRDDDLELNGVYISCVVRCAPPDNKPAPDERDRCIPFLREEMAGLPNARAILALGAFAWDGVLAVIPPDGKKPSFGHGAEYALGGLTLFGSYHVSQQNTFTGRLTEAMFDEVVARAQTHAQQPGAMTVESAATRGICSGRSDPAR